MRSKYFLLAMFLPLFSVAQNTEGEIVYNAVIKLNIEMPDDMAEEFKNQIPSSQTFTKSLVFNQERALYKDWEADQGDIEFSHEENGNDFQMVIKRPVNDIFTDLKKGTIVNQREFFGRMFLIDGGTHKFQWKLTGEQKKISGYTCQKATCQHDEDNIVAWFTPQIPLSIGPGEYAGLPGLILEVDINDGDRIYTPKKIEMREVKKDELVAPKKGKKISQEDFDKMEKKKMKEMEEEMGGSGGGIKMIITDDVDH